jgi:hypothetical protein
MSGSFEVKDHDSVDSISHPTRRKVEVALAIDMDSYWERLSVAYRGGEYQGHEYRGDSRAVTRDFVDATPPWVMDKDGKFKPAFTSERLSQLRCAEHLMKADEGIRSEDMAALAKVLELNPGVETAVIIEDLLPTKLPAGSSFTLLSQAGLASFSPDRIFPLLNTLLGELVGSYSLRKNTEMSERPSMALGFSYKEVESGDYEFKIRAEGKGITVPNSLGDVFLGHMETVILFDSNHQLIPGQKVSLDIELSLPVGGPYDALVESMTEENFYVAMGLLDKLGACDVSTWVDDVLSFSKMEVTSNSAPEKMLEFQDHFQQKPEIIRAKTVDVLVNSSIIYKEEKEVFSSEKFTEKFIKVWTNTSDKQKSDLEADYIRRSTAFGDTLFVDEDSGKKKMDETIRSYITPIRNAMMSIDDFVFRSSQKADAHERREAFRDLFVKAYEKGSLEKKFALQWRYRTSLTDPTSSLHALMTKDVSLSTHEVGGVPVGHTAVEIDRFFDEEVKRAREEKETEIKLKANAKVKAEALTQFYSLEKTLVNDLLSEAVGKKPLVVFLPKAVVVKESSVPELPEVNSLIAKREKLELAKQTSKFMLCCSFVVVAGFLGGPIAAGAAVIISLIIVGAINYLKNERADRRRISRTPATALVVGQRSKSAVPALSRDADFASEAK